MRCCFSSFVMRTPPSNRPPPDNTASIPRAVMSNSKLSFHAHERRGPSQPSPLTALLLGLLSHPSGRQFHLGLRRLASGQEASPLLSELLGVIRIFKILPDVRIFGFCRI